MENRHGLVVDTRLTQATGSAEREAALEMLTELPGEAGKSVGADKLFDTEDFVQRCRELNVTPHVAQKYVESQQPCRQPHDAPRRLLAQSVRAQAHRDRIRR